MSRNLLRTSTILHSELLSYLCTYMNMNCLHISKIIICVLSFCPIRNLFQQSSSLFYPDREKNPRHSPWRHVAQQGENIPVLIWPILSVQNSNRDVPGGGRSWWGENCCRESKMLNTALENKIQIRPDPNHSILPDPTLSFDIKS